MGRSGAGTVILPGITWVAGILFALTAGCASSGATQGTDASASPAVAEYAAAVDELFALVEPVGVEGNVLTEDRSPLPRPTIVRATSQVTIERRRIGGDWQIDETHGQTFADSTTVGDDGRYFLQIPAVVETGVAAEIAYRDPETGTGFVRFADTDGIRLESEGGGASAKDLVIADPSEGNRLDFTLRYPPLRRNVMNDNVPVFAEPVADADTIYTLSFGAVVNQVRLEGDWARVRYAAGLFGWMKAARIADPDTFAKAREERDREWQRRVDKLGRPAAIAAALKQRKVIEGMRPSDVELAWGKPDHTDKTKEAGSVRTRWLFAPKGDRGSRQVIFEKNRVIQVTQD